MSEITRLIEIAKAEVGYLEKKTNSNLDSKTANAGTNNYTKYARDLDSIKGFYNGKKNGYAWCDMFVDWCFVKAFGVERAKELLNHGTLGAGCTYSAQYYKKNNQWYNSPKIGDQIFFKNSKGSIIHTGIVVNFDSKKVYTIEGNTSSDPGVVANGGSVNDKSYNLNSSSIAGYGRPNYKEEEVVKTEVKYVYNCTSLNVRKTPNGTIVRTIKKGTQVNVYEIGGSWARIGTNEWCFSKYLSKTKPSSYPTKTVYNCTALNVRKGAGTKYGIVRTLKRGDKVTIYKINGNWAKISSSKEEWCSSSYLK